MGYYTRFELNESSFGLENIEEVFNKISSYNLEYLSEEGGNEIKWYLWEEDMIKLSNLYPCHLFILSGIGEEDGDIWRAYFEGGKKIVYKAKIVFPEFSKLHLK